jgi:hypothetical protein
MVELAATDMELSVRAGLQAARITPAMIRP